MPIAETVIEKFKCPHCGMKSSIAENIIGEEVECIKCNKYFPIEDNWPVLDESEMYDHSKGGRF